MTAYNPVRGQTDSTPTIAACGSIYSKKANRHGTPVALSPNLYREGYSCGEHIRVFYDGYWHNHTVWDKTSSRFFNRVDIMVHSYARAMQIGVQKGKIK